LLAVSLWSEIRDRPDLLIDVGLLIVLGFIHTAAWREIDLERATGEAKEAGAGIRAAAAAGLTVVGILVPLTVLAINLRSNPDLTPLSNDVLVDLFVASVWLLISLACGLYVLWAAAIRAYEANNVKGDKSVGIVVGYQLFFLFVGVFREVWGLAALVSDLLQ
jgi:hypothetical protein